MLQLSGDMSEVDMPEDLESTDDVIRVPLEIKPRMEWYRQVDRAKILI